MKIVFLNPVDVSVCPMRKQNPAIAAAAISALGGLASNALSAGTNVSMNKATRDWQHNESLIARQWQEDMYNKYQSPHALVSQQLQAGINPYISDTGTGGSMPSTEVPSAPNPPTLHFDNVLGQGVDTFMKYKSMEAQNNSLRAEAMSKLFDTAMRVYKEYGEKAGDEFMKSQLPQFDMQGQKNITRMVDNQIQREQIAKQREELMRDVEKTYSPKKAQADLDMIDQQITESVARIGKMASDAKVNEAEINQMAADVAKKIAETGYYKALGGQISRLTPYLEDQANFAAGSMGLDFGTKEAEYEGNEEYRKWLRSDKAKQARKHSQITNPQNNAFVNGLGNFTDALNLNLSSGVHANVGK